jgi:glycosyltransferase involved in cell wall biosynthesis
LSNVAAVSFCAHAQARPFLDSGLIAVGTRICEIPESTSRFTPGSRTEARGVMGVDGDPLVLWVGHLDANKDPLTVLDGISLASRALPRLELCCCFGSAPLMREVQAKVATDPNLRERVSLLGRVPHAAVEQLMRAADLFVLGSHREGSGYALIEAMACGLPPAVTDIPSFRALTGSGTVGALWPCGDARALCEAVVESSRRPKAETREAVRAHFDAELSFEALGRKLRAMYEEVLTAQREGLRAHSVRARGRR